MSVTKEEYDLLITLFGTDVNTNTCGIIGNTAYQIRFSNILLIKGLHTGGITRVVVPISTRKKALQYIKEMKVEHLLES